jgi:hypothetical protein
MYFDPMGLPHPVQTTNFMGKDGQGLASQEEKQIQEHIRCPKQERHPRKPSCSIGSIHFWNLLLGLQMVAILNFKTKV